MRRNRSFFIVVGVILLVLAGLYFNTGQLRKDREAALAQLDGGDEMARVLRAEAEDFREVNRKQQIGILWVGGAVVAVALVWWGGQ